MYCPKCSQSQGSDDASFCSRCGFRLGVVKDLISTGGVLPLQQAAAIEQDGSARGDRGIRLGIKLIFSSVILLPAFIALSRWFDSPIPLSAPVTIFLAGLATILYSGSFTEFVLSNQKRSPAFAGVTQRRSLGGPAEQIRLKRLSTAEFIEPISVTESTTRNLRVAAD